jgi:mono/diheme cytochrome c family protein
MIKSMIGFGLMASLMAGAGTGYAGEIGSVERGKEVYKTQRCAMCHAIAGAGNRRHPLDDVGSRLTPDVIRTWIVAPQEMDPKVRKKAYALPPEDLDALVAYLRTLQAPSQ